MFRIIAISLAVTLSGFLLNGGGSGAQTPPAFGRITATAYRLVQQTVVDGVVVDEKLEPISDARVSISELAVDMPLDRFGSADLSALPIGQGDEATVTVVFTAPGLGSFTFRNLEIGGGLLPNLTPVLTDQPRVTDVSRGARAAIRTSATSGSTESGTGEAASDNCMPWFDTNTYPPQSIRVYENAPGQDGLVHLVDFNFYAKHVLPREWDASWNAESLRAGAVVVKSYAWWHAMAPGHKHTTPSGACYDVDARCELSPDTCNHQKFNPFLSDASTDAAVDYTWNNYMVQGSSVVQAFYKSGDSSDGCGQWYGRPPPPIPGNDMSQYGSQACAVTGMPWWQILTVYYFPPEVSWQLIGAPAPPPEVKIRPSSNTYAIVEWAGQAELEYHLCADPGFMSSFKPSTCTLIGTGQSAESTAVQTGERYYRLLVCANGYCSAPRAGGVNKFDQSGNRFYGTAYYSWPFAYVAGRNLSGSNSGIIVSDGAVDFGNTPQHWCQAIRPSRNCGRWGWASSNPIVTVSQYLSLADPLSNAFLRLIRNAIGD